MLNIDILARNSCLLNLLFLRNNDDSILDIISSEIHPDNMFLIQLSLSKLLLFKFSWSFSISCSSNVDFLFL